MKINKLHIIVLFLMLNTLLFAQNKQLERANELYESKSYVLAIAEYEQILEKEVLPEAMLNLALSYWQIRKADKAEQWFEIASLNGGFNRSNEYFYPELIYNYAEVLKFNGKYKAAKEQFLEFEQITGNSKGGLQAKICDVIPVLMRDSSKVEIKDFEYNTERTEFSPQLNNDILYFVGTPERASQSDIDQYTGEPYLDILMSKYPGTDSSEAPKALNKKINTSLNEGPMTFSRKGDKIIFTRNYFAKGSEQRRSDGFLGFGLFESSTEGIEKWTDPKQLDLGEIEYNFAHPSLSYNGELLYFAADVPGGFGGTDIYVSTRLADGWSSPRNLGPSVNTQGNEAYPYIHLTGTLYFASDYHQGLGGRDIFSARKDEEGNWSNIRNLGYPINSSADDFGLFLKPDSREGYFSSNRPGGKGGDDIYNVFIDAPMDELMDVDSLISVLDGVDSTSNEDSLAMALKTLNTATQSEENQMMQVEKDALKNTSGGYFEFVYGDEYNAEMSVEDELKLLQEMELGNREEVRQYFGEDESLRTTEELEKELQAYSQEKEKQSEENAGHEKEKPEKPAEKKITKEEKPEPAKTADIPLEWSEYLDAKGNLIVNENSSKFKDKSIDGLVFRIQIGAYRLPVFGGPEQFFGKKNIESYKLEDEITRYLLPQSFESIQKAENYRKSLESDQLKDAFIVPFFNAKRIGMEEAIGMLVE